MSLRRNARVGAAVGIGLAALLYVPRIPGLDVGTTGSAGLFLGLAVVLAVTTAAVVTAGLSAKVLLEPVLDRRAWLRRGGTAGVVGGLLWAGLPALAWFAGAGAIDVGLWRAATGIAALLLVVGTAGLHAAVRGGAGGRSGGLSNRLRRLERVAYWVVVLALLLAAGNASGDASPVAETAAGPFATPFLIAAFLAFVAAVPFAASAELLGSGGGSTADGGRFGGRGSWGVRALQLGALAGTLGVAWLVVGGGWGWLTAVAGGSGTTAAGLAVASVPTGVGWAIAGATLRTGASRRLGAGNPSQ